MKQISKRLTRPVNLILVLMLLVLMTACGKSDGGGAAAPSGQITGDVFFGESNDKSHVEGTLITVISIPEDWDSVANLNSELSSYSTVVDSSGRYLINVPVGKYSVVAEGPGKTKAYGKVTVTQGETVTQDFTLMATATLRGQLDHPQFSYGTRVSIKNTQYVTTCNVNGEFVLNDVPLGTFIIMVYGESSYNIGAFSVTIVPGINDVGVVSDLNLIPEVTLVTAKNNDVLCHSDLSDFRINFSIPMDTKITGEAITISTGTILENLELQWNYDSELLIRNFAELLDGYYGDVELIIGMEAVSLEGKHLIQPLVLKFNISEKIMSTVPEDGYRFFYLEEADTGSGLSEVRINFSDAIQPSTFQFAIEPSLAGSTLVEWQDKWATNGNVAVIKGAFAENTDYTITISSATTTSGIDIAKLPYTFSFKTTRLQVISTYPSNGAEGVFPENGFTIRFNGNMNRELVNENLLIKETLTNETITPAKITWTGETYYGATGGETLEVEFDAAYGKTYTIELADVTSLYGVPLEDFSMSYTTLIPEMTSMEYDASRNQISMYFNTMVNWEKSDFSMASLSDNTAVLFDFYSSYGNTIIQSGGGSSNRIYIRPSEALDPETEYKLSWLGLEAIATGDLTYSLEEGDFIFETKPLHLMTTNPASGSNHISINKHSVLLSFSSLVPDSMKSDIEVSLSVQAEKSGSTTSLSPVFFWDDTGVTESVLYIDFMFDYETRYTINIDTSQNQEFTEIFKKINTVEFLTKPAPGTGTVPDLFDSFGVDNNNEISHSYSGWEIRVDFNVWVDLKAYPPNQIVELRNSNGALVSFYGSVNSYYSTKTIAGRVYAKSWIIQNLPFDYGKTYSVTLTDKMGIYDDGSGYNNNLPAEIAVKTKSPSISVSVDNEDGLLVVRAGSGFYLSLADVQNSMRTIPEIEIVEEIYTEEGAGYSNRIGFRYKPVQTAHLQVDTGPLTAFNKTSESGTDQYGEVCKFRNTPYHNLFVIEPDDLPPVLNTAYALNDTSAVLIFNTNLDADTAREATNYTITDDSNTIIPVQNVILSPRYGDDEVGPDYSGPVGAGVTLETGSDLSSGRVYTITVSNITEWGGNYTISNENNSCTFDGYDGALISLSSLSYTYQNYVGETLESTFIKVIPVVFDVPVETEDAEDLLQVEVKYNSSDPYTIISKDFIQWNNEESAAAIRISSQQSFYDLRLVFTGDIKNKIAGRNVYLGGYTREINSSYYSLRFDCYKSGDQLRVDFNSSTELMPVHYDIAGNYTIHHVTILSGLPAVTGVTPGYADSAILTLSEALPVTGSYLMRLEGVHDPKLTALGLGSATPVLTDVFRY